MPVISGGGTNHLKGFNAAAQVFSLPTNRTDVPQIVVFITDGDPSDFPGSAAAVSVLIYITYLYFIMFMYMHVCN